jgi:hypothetical protein
MIAAFRMVYFCAIALSASAGTLVTASLFIADRAPQSGTFLGISIVITAFFLVLALVLYGVQRHVAAIAGLVKRGHHQNKPEIASNVTRLVAYLLTGGGILAIILGVITYAIAARIDQGFAVFG